MGVSKLRDVRVLHPETLGSQSEQAAAAAAEASRDQGKWTKGYLFR
jgi:hypothetical protein